ncbi:Keratin, type I cytoskeletal 50 kDa GK50 [Takifugu flavidus]|uniref:Keratin, type I cytoskeletal 50 kDa GK50 n=1 Tax=Takifugu flavidus TaxID=433684 RepID=A0A5C6NT81_9TELE|nr:Keratin, type I cytoskeletal 50 kDa GK50 [Takifugu flavidus]
MGGKVTVEEDARRGKELEPWFQTMTTDVKKEVVLSTETLHTSKSEIGEVRRTLQNLEIQLQTQISRSDSVLHLLTPSKMPDGPQVLHTHVSPGGHHQQKDAVGATLAETKHRCSNMLAGCRGQLSQLRADLENQKFRYSQLLDIKTRLELDIAEYRRLLGGDFNGKWTPSEEW